MRPSWHGKSRNNGDKLGIFSKQYEQLREYLEAKRACSTVFHSRGEPDWPRGSSRNVILAMDTRIELGSPKAESMSALIVCGEEEPVNDGAITLIGDDFVDIKNKVSSFGKIALVSCRDTDESNLYDRYRNLESLRFEVDLKGYMIKAVSQYKREWSRISCEAVANRFSFEILGSQLIETYKKCEYVESAEVIFVTRGEEDVRELRGIGDGTARIVGAMNKMMEELESDCDECEYQEICDELEELREMKARHRNH